jgi:hypothetical protein
MTHVANAIRRVAAGMQQAIDASRRSGRIDADDLIDALLAVADELDPPAAERAADACPDCGESRRDLFVWRDDETVLCGRCGRNFTPGR